jgi:hypothetical protein
MNKRLDELIGFLGGQMRTDADRARIGRAIEALDERYDLAAKIAREPGVEEIVKQMAGRLASAYPDLGALAGLRILDIACGSSTSKAPPLLIVHSPFGEGKVKIPGVEGYTAQFEPWFCRILLALGAEPVGVDIGELDGEGFEHYRADLGQPGALDFLADASFDGVQDSRLFGSPEFTAQFPEIADRVKVAAEIRRQEMRLLKPGGRVIHSDAEALLRRGA